MTLVILGLVIGSSAPTIFAAEQTNKAKDVEKAEKGRDQTLKTQLGLLQAKASQLKAEIALRIEHSPEKAKQALLEADRYLSEASASASRGVVKGITALKNETNDVIKSLTLNAEDAKENLGVLIANTENQIKSYGDRIKKSEETALFKKRYAQLEAQAALLKARLAARTTAGYEQAQAYLDDAKAWYAHSKAQVKEAGSQQIEAMEKGIDAAKASMEKKEKQARHQLSDLLIQAADMVKDEK
ncbi:MAG: hypothetical protein J7M20_11430 [Deltaproteobacteria bacterium]|nr:hypothetical protein [Deltaproteobacteria bacterium]